MLTPEQKESIDRAAKREPHNLSFRPSRPFDFFLWIEHQELDAYVGELAAQIEANGARRKRDDATQAKFLFSIKLILLNLLATEKATLKILQAIPRQNNVFSANSRYSQKHVAYRPFTDAYDGLLDLKLATIVIKGFHPDIGQGQVTRIEATHKLKKKLNALFPQEVVYFSRHPDEETIKLRNKSKKLMEYEDTSYTREARDNLRTINACLNRHWYDLRLSEAEFNAMYADIVRRHKKSPKKPVSIRFSSRSLYRIYNNGDIADGENFKQGGRFYGGWWEAIPSKYRKKIMIDDKPTVEIDYSGYHPRMLYALEGIDIGNRDPYLPNGLKEEWRDFGKLAFTKLLNGKKRLDEPDDYDDKAVGISWKELLTAMENHHTAIAKYFRTGYGLDLQRKDSDIAERIILDFAKRGIACLPVHDSFIVHHAYAEELDSMMKREYGLVFEQGINTKIDNGFKLFTEEYTEQGESSYDLEHVLTKEQESQYQRRMNLWWQNTEQH